ncbi:hypothetical protein CRG98_032822, partial [Punica granatum]
REEERERGAGIGLGQDAETSRRRLCEDRRPGGAGEGEGGGAGVGGGSFCRDTRARINALRVVLGELCFKMERARRSLRKKETMKQQRSRKG